jgi:hypothetical protein
MFFICFSEYTTIICRDSINPMVLVTDMQNDLYEVELDF